jgi:LmbE family N-acetylglucosaminyl deacetylase
MKAYLALVCATAVAGVVPYATSIQPSIRSHNIPANRGAAALWQSLKKLDTRASLIMVTAHPDDEDGGMLVEESRGRGARVTLLTLNRGEGGANVMSPHYFDALGLIRTQELLAAGEYYGVDQFWTRVIDYGFSKTKAESISRWTHDRVLADVVRVIRMTRPLVITSVFVGGVTDGHGNHQTAGAMAQEAFEAAGNPKMFPEHFQEGLRPWTPLKVYARTPWFGRGEKDFSVDVTVQEGTFDPALGASYVQLAREGLGFQKSQNGGAAIPKLGPVASTYHRFGSHIAVNPKEESFFDGIDVSLAGIAGLVHSGDPAFLNIHSQVEAATRQFSIAHPEASAPALAAGMKATDALLKAVAASNLTEQEKADVQFELDMKHAQFNNALAEALGLSVDAVVTPEKEPDPRFAMFMGDPDTPRVAIPGQKIAVKVHAVNPSDATVQVSSVHITPQDGGTDWRIQSAPFQPLSLSGNHVSDTRIEVTVPNDAHFTRPYFTRPDIEQSYYDIGDAKQLNRPASPYPLAGWAEFTYQGVPIRVGEVVQTGKRMTGLGQVLEPLIVGPAIAVGISPRAGIVPLDARSLPVTVTLHSNVKGPASGTVRLDLPAGWSSNPPSVPFTMSADGDERSVSFEVTPAQLSTTAYHLSAVAEYDGHTYREGYQAIGYPGLRTSYLYEPASYRTTGVDVKVAPGLRVGYIAGSGDDVPAALESLGVKPTFLGPSDIAGGNLSNFDVILLGVRTYAAREELKTYNSRLLDYVKNGGVMIVQYNTPEFDHNFGPYPYVMGRDPEEVTDEASKITILEPQNPIFNWPNKVTAADFDNWVEERGSKWLKSWDPQYHALLETHDPDQPPQKGGLLYARYGKGIYIYNAYAFYRQLPEGVGGAYRIMANMLSLPKNPAARQ